MSITLQNEVQRLNATIEEIQKDRVRIRADYVYEREQRIIAEARYREWFAKAEEARNERNALRNQLSEMKEEQK